MSNFKVKTKALVFFMTLALIFSFVSPAAVYAEETNPQDLPTIRYEDNNKALQFVGNWVNDVNSNSSGGSGKYSNTAGDYMKFDFTGTGFKIIGYGGQNKGYAKITIDGVEETYDFYTEKDSPQVDLYTKSGLKFGKHSLKIEVLSQSGYKASNAYIYIDAIDVLNASKDTDANNNEPYISNIADISNSVYIDEDYTLPKTVTANLSDGSSKTVEVTWDKTNVDTSRSGTMHILGTVIGCDKKVNLTLNILQKHSSSIKNYTQIASSGSHSLAIKSDGTVWAWGNNDYGQLGNSTSQSESIPIQVSGLNDVTAVAAHQNYSLALKKDGTVWEWGQKYDGILNENKQLTPSQIKGLSNVISISCGDAHSLALKSDGTVWAWGENYNYGQLGDGTYVNRTSPVQVKTIKDITAISAFYGSSLALDKNGQVWQWGFTQTGSTSSTPNNVMIGDKGEGALSNVVKITGCRCMLKSDGTVWQCSGIKGHPFSEQVKGISDGIDISSNVGSTTVLVLKKDGTVWGWGDDRCGQLCDGSTGFRDTAVKVNGLTNIKWILCEGNTCYAIKNDGTALAWGSNAYGLLGNMNFKVDDGAKLLLNDVNQVYNESDRGKYAIKNDGSVWSIGNDTFQIKNLNDIVSMWGNLALKKDGTVWQYNQYVENNNPESNNENQANYVGSENADQINGIDNVKTIIGNYALKNDGTVWCFNFEDPGEQLKDSKYVVTQVNGLKDIVQVYSYASNILALDKNGDVWSWTEDATKRDKEGKYNINPKKVDGVNNVESINMYYEKNIAIKKDGTVWMFDDYEDKTPTKIYGISNAQSVYYKYGDIYVIQKDGTVYRCVNFGNMLLPSKMDGLSDITEIIQPSMYSTVYAVKKDGTVWRFGIKYAGKENGQNTFTDYDPYQDENFKDIAYIDAGYALTKNGTVIKLNNNEEEVNKDDTIEFELTPSTTEKYENVKQVITDDNGKILNIVKNDGTLYDLDNKYNINNTGSSSTPVEVYCN